MGRRATISWRELGLDRVGEFVAKGHRQRSFFPHRVAFLPRPGPDGYKLAQRMCGESDPACLLELVLFADEAALDGFPPDLFFDDDLIWHRQHFGRPGHVAVADVVIRGPDMWTMSHFSDLVQRIGRRREHKTQIENRFKGWYDLVLNALLAFAVERDVRRLHIPTSDFQLQNTDPSRRVQPELFERIYDRGVNRILVATRTADWWVVDVEANRGRAVAPTVHQEEIAPVRTISICHDVEAGLGHRGSDDSLAEHADRTWRESVAAMLRHEHESAVSATYNVVGQLLAEVGPEIEAGGHCIGFHSYDHAADDTDQLSACRRVDYRLKGYRPPRSEITPGLTDENLLFHNFEWLASSQFSLGASQPELRNGVVRLPIHLDDFALYQGQLRFDAWKAKLLETVATNDAAVLSLHDCYAQLWLDRYPDLLEDLSELGEVRTLDELAADLTLGAAV